MQPNDFVLSLVKRGQQYCLLAVTLIAGAILAAWLVPAVRLLLPGSWWMQRPRSVCLLLCVASLVLPQERQSRRAVVLSRVLAAVLILMAAETLREAMLGDPSFVDMLFSTHSQASMTLVGVVLLGLRARTGWCRA
jgi:hypothetical protein